ETIILDIRLSPLAALSSRTNTWRRVCRIMRIEGNGERLKLAHSYAKFRPLTRPAGSARMARMTRSSKAHKRRNGRGARTPASPSNPLKKKTIETSGASQKATAEIVVQSGQQQHKQE